MGLFDTLEQAAGMTGASSGQGAAPEGAIGAVIQMLQAQPGGVAGVLQTFERAGLGGVVQSWLGSGANAPVSPDQVQQTLGAGPVAQVASQLGVSPETAAGHISQLLPLILDHISPNGQAPEGGGLTELESLLGRFAGRS